VLQFTIDVSAADAESRTIEGLAVPYGELAILNGERYAFEPGSVALARARTPLLLGHDQSRPVGVLSELTDGEGGVRMRFAIDGTPDGDAALAQAASGSRGGLSIGAEIDAYTELDGGVRSVTAARVFETSLVALSAFENANVERVAAELETPPPPPEPEPDDDDDDQGDEPATERNPMQETIEASAPVVIAATRPQADLTATELVNLIVRAQHGERDARHYLEAALVESISTDLSGVLPPAYETSVMGGKQTARPLYSFFRSRPLPGVGLAINKPRWTTPPDGAWATTVDDDAHSTKVVIGADSANVERWDWAGAIPYVVVQRSSPDVIDAIYAEAVQDFYYDVEIKIATLLAASTTNAATSIGAAVAAYFNLNKRNPDGILIAADVWGKMADQKLIDATRATGDVSLSTDGMAGTWAGLPVIVSGTLPATMGYLVSKRAIDARVTEPVRLTANAIGALNVELAVVGEGLFDVDYQNEIMELAPTIPVGELTTGRGSK